MRIIFCGLSLALLAACGDATTSNAANDSIANMTAAEPAANSAAPSYSDADLRRADEISECVQDVALELPTGTDVYGFCGCAVDNMTGGRGERQAMEACATRMGISTNGM